MHINIAQAQIPKWTPKWLALQILSIICLAISLLAMSGSITQVVVDCRHYKPFVTQENRTQRHANFQLHDTASGA